jgi:hypothetical protein
MSHLKFLLDENISHSLLQYLLSMLISADFVSKGIMLNGYKIIE